MSKAQYDPEVIQRFADKLYSQANTIIFAWAFLGLAVGGGGGYTLGGDSNETAFAVLGGSVLCLLGVAIGSARAFLLKLRAQTALCQMKIEENTRRRTQ